ncbi:hypothetical protein CEE44_00840 [Candidatus Woesearchaeota archaeon B3_Woes]|nr:MAG: hypothetical protein CEE44_00840 [Candidatus Woesearchaeota archaeon B3_Woes]
MHDEAQNSSPIGENNSEVKSFSELKEQNEELHNIAKEIMSRMGEVEQGTHKKFIHEVMEKYKDVQKKKDGKYSQDWASYNKVQSKEKLLLMNILDELLNYVEFPEDKKCVGRKPVDLKEKIFYTILQAYNLKSGRRCISDLEIARKLGYVNKTPHFNTVLNCLKDQSLTIYLKHLIEVSGIPLKQIESDFAVDASGFSTSEFGRWFDVRTGSNSDKRKYRKCHITCGVRTNIITAVNITKGTRSDSPEFPDLIKKTNRIYDIKEVSADKGYTSRENLQAVSNIGAIPFIPFKKNIKPNTRSKNVDIWRKMYMFFTHYPEEFDHHYHKRSNVETCFHMIKRKFNSHLRSRTETGQDNEVLAKCLCHNLCVLAQEAMELGIELDFKKCADIEVAHN